MSFIPHTDADRQAMLKRIGVERIVNLFHDIPAEKRYVAFDLPDPLSEMEAGWELGALSRANVDVNQCACFLGAGAYNHYVPSVVDYVLQRGEFYTAYTPYQPEISQGTLQAIFEYQSMVCALTGMDVANASHYDGATSLAEAVIMAVNVHRGKRTKIILSPAIHPEYRQVVRTYTQGMGLNVVGDEDLEADLAALQAMVDDDTAMLAVQNPNFFGQVEELSSLAEACHAHKALLTVVADPISLGMFKAPGSAGADIVVGEGQALGGGLNFGGPYLGFFATRKKHVRRMAGRLVGETSDTDGQRGYVLTLSTREQHIRREKATSNICTNQGLLALAAGVYMAALGRCGLPQIASLCYHKAHYAAAQIDALKGYAVWQDKPFFKEFVVRCPEAVAEINAHLLERWDIIGGYDLGRDYPHLEDHMLVAVTEVNTREEIDDLAAALEEVAS
ncbi:MAG: aminomethyl-transferring glycine dehydrogenase subunit GcvPA [Anaerolineae bacterium]|jgi:glycine dehydrogenase subunit 1